jgi:pimeloyl-ACP methyl ester carboxylesterase
MTSSTPMPSVEGVTHRDVIAGDVRLHVAEAGEGDPVVLLHGWPQHWYMWRHLIPLLATDRRVICPDLRGFGWSEAPAGDLYEKETFATDTLALLDALELDRVDLIGHDWGGWAGFTFCLDHPDRVGAYLALSIVPPWPESPSPERLLGIWRLSYQAVLATPGLGTTLLRNTDVVKRMIPSGAAHPEAWTDADLEAFAAPLREPARAEASAQLYRTFLTRELLPFVRGRYVGRRLTVPTRLLIGARDPVIDGKYLGPWREWADDMEVEVRDDSAHFMPEELPGYVADRARALFDRQRAGATA